MNTSNCKRGLFGRLLCKFEPRYSEEVLPIPSLIMNEEGAYDRILTYKKYVGDVCKKCGAKNC